MALGNLLGQYGQYAGGLASGLASTSSVWTDTATSGTTASSGWANIFESQLQQLARQNKPNKPIQSKPAPKKLSSFREELQAEIDGWLPSLVA